MPSEWSAHLALHSLGFCWEGGLSLWMECIFVTTVARVWERGWVSHAHGEECAPDRGTVEVVRGWPFSDQVIKTKASCPKKDPLWAEVHGTERRGCSVTCTCLDPWILVLGTGGQQVVVARLGTQKWLWVWGRGRRREWLCFWEVQSSRAQERKDECPGQSLWFAKVSRAWWESQTGSQAARGAGMSDRLCSGLSSTTGGCGHSRSL
jgi:hypothetical protein